MYVYHDYISSEEFEKYSRSLSKLIGKLNKLRERILEMGKTIDAAGHGSKQPQKIASVGLIIAQYFTYSSIVILFENNHFSDAYILLRVLYEGHLHLWNIIKGNKEQARSYLNLKYIKDWKLYNEERKIYPHLKDSIHPVEMVRDVEKRYKKAIKYFGLRDGKIPGNYTTFSNKDLAKMMDEKEGTSPYKQFMHINLFIKGSENIHRTHFGILKTHASVEINEVDGKSFVAPLIPSMRLGLEIAWMASSIIIDCYKWIFEFLKVKYPNDLKSIYEDIQVEVMRGFGVIEEDQNT